jgi:hypothetical protein
MIEANDALIKRRRQSGGGSPASRRLRRIASVGGGGVVQLTGSVVENPHGLHWNTYKFSAKARLMTCSKIIGRPHTGQTTSFVSVTSSLILHLRMRCRVPAMI